MIGSMGPSAIMPGLRKSNKFISRDENKHVELACILYGLLKNRLKESVIQATVRNVAGLSPERAQ